MTDPLSVSASVLGILGFTVQIIKLLDEYVGSVKSAPDEAHALRTETAAIQSVLNRFVDFFNTGAIDELNITFINGCVLLSAVDECRTNIERLYMAIGKINRAKKSNLFTADIVQRFKWPFKKGECKKEMQTLRRLLQIFEFLSVSRVGMSRISEIRIMSMLTSGSELLSKNAA
jgi:hypothetical protein